MDDVDLLKAALRAALELAETRRLQFEAATRALEKLQVEVAILKDTVSGMATTKHVAAA